MRVSAQERSDTMSQIVFTKDFLNVEHGRTVVHGILAPESLYGLEVGEYQRGILTPRVIAEMVTDLEAGSFFPEMRLGMRIGGTITRNEEGFVLEGETFIIDGRQRWEAYKKLDGKGKGEDLSISAVCFTDTNEDWERGHFCDSNLKTHRLSTNLLLFNWQYDYRAVQVLVQLCKEDTHFALYHKVQWGQRKNKTDLISGVTLARAVAYLHEHLGVLVGSTIRLDVTSQSLQQALEQIGEADFQANVYNFFEIIDHAFGIRNIALPKLPAYISPSFLFCLAKLFSGHEDFWQNNTNRLHFNKPDLMRKLGDLPYYDPEFRHLASLSRTMAQTQLYNTLFGHMNSRKALTPRGSVPATPAIDRELAEVYFAVLRQVYVNGPVDNGKEVARAVKRSE